MYSSYVIFHVLAYMYPVLKHYKIKFSEKKKMSYNKSLSHEKQITQVRLNIKSIQSDRRVHYLLSIVE